MTAPERVHVALHTDGTVHSAYASEARARDVLMADGWVAEVVTYVRERPAPVLPIQLLNPHAIAPRRAHADDAGLDCHALLGMLQSANDPDTVTLAPHGGAAVIRLGFAVAIPRGHVGLLTGRSGLASKGVHVSQGVIDAGYRGEVCAHLTNHGSEPFVVTHGDRITQLIVLPIVLANVLLVDALPPSLDGRGESGFGSTGTAPSGPGDEVSR